MSKKSSEKSKPPKKLDAQNKEERIWKIVYIILCLALLTLTAYQLITMLRDNGYGWDFLVFRGGVQAIDHMQNPYILKNIQQYTGEGTPLPFAYPPNTLYIFWVLDLFFVFENMGIYYALLIVLMLISGCLIAMMDQKPHYLFLITLMLTSFMSTYWNFLMGNKDILFLFFLAIIFKMLVMEKYWQSSIVMGLMGSVALVTGPFVALYFFVRRPWLNRLFYIFLSGVVVAVLLVAGYCVNPIYFGSYIDLITGGQNPLNDIGGYMTPTPYLMFGDLLKGINVTGSLPVAIVLCIYIGLVIYATWIFSVKNSENMVKVYSIATLAVFMLLPRIKPYSFIILIVPLYFLFRDCSYRMKILLFTVISFLPLFVWYTSPLGIPRTYGMQYIQSYSLILIFLVVILYDHLTSASNEKKKARKNRSLEERTPAE
jgi:hypothetical protein